jgi:hypothetical protein
MCESADSLRESISPARQRPLAREYAGLHVPRSTVARRDVIQRWWVLRSRKCLFGEDALLWPVLLNHPWFQSHTLVRFH